MIARLAGLVLLAGGGLIRWLAIQELRRTGLTDSQFFHVIQPPRYTRSGPYAISDHPCYVGSLLMMAAQTGNTRG